MLRIIAHRVRCSKRSAMQQSLFSTNASEKEAYRRRIDVTTRKAVSHKDGSI
jgi:hypothetical protein